MWLLNATTFELESFTGNDVPRYAILSHRWEQDEVTFKDVAKKRYHGKRGFMKVSACCQQTLAAGLSYIWIDTCCIDKKSSAELSEAINSMYSWYSRSAVCFAYLSDVRASSSPAEDLDAVVESKDGPVDVTKSVWFSRGWTLQELLAPSVVSFYDGDWVYLGEKEDHAKQIRARTGIPETALTSFRPAAWSVLERMSWAASRDTTRLEDRAYSLLGLFEVNMPLLYGEGSKAFKRLQEHIAAGSSDISLFAWQESSATYSQFVTDDPKSFSNVFPVLWPRKSNSNTLQVIRIDHPGFTKFQPSRSQYRLTKEGLEGNLCLNHHVFNIYRLCVGHMFSGFGEDQDYLKMYFCIFLEQIGPSNVFRRVRFNGSHCLALATRASNSQSTTTKQCKIISSPIEAASPTRFTSEQWHRFLNSDITDMSSGKITFVSGGYVRSQTFHRIVNGFQDMLAISLTLDEPAMNPCLIFHISADTSIGERNDTPLLVALYKDKWSGMVSVMLIYPFTQLSMEPSSHQETDFKVNRRASYSLNPTAKISASKLVTRVKNLMHSSSEETKQMFQAENGRSLPLRPAVATILTLEIGSSCYDMYDPLTLAISQLGPTQQDGDLEPDQYRFDLNCYLPGLEALPHTMAQFPGLKTKPMVPIWSQGFVSASYDWPARHIFQKYFR